MSTLLGILGVIALAVGTVLFWIFAIKLVIDYAARRFAEEKRRNR